MSNEKYCCQLNELERADARTSGDYYFKWSTLKMLTIPTAAIGFYSRKAYELGDTFTQLRYNKSLYKYWFDQHYNSDGTIK